MKRTIMKAASIFLTIVVLLSMCGIQALAETFNESLSLPDAMNTTEAGEFAGMATLNRVKLPASLKTVDARAFEGCSALQELELPAALLRIEDAAFANCTALGDVKMTDKIEFIASNAFSGCPNVRFIIDVSQPGQQSYAERYALNHDIPYSKTGDVSDLAIERITCSASGDGQLNRSIIWAVQTSGGSGAKQYRYQLRLGSEIIAQQDFSSSNFFSYTPNTAGAYMLEVTCRDGEGQSCTDAASLRVKGKPLTLVFVSCDATSAIVGDELTWRALVCDGLQPIQYQYELLVDNVLVETQAFSEEVEYRYSANTAGEYLLHVTAIDAEATICTLDSEAISVLSQEQVKPSAPEWVFEDASCAFSEQMADAPSYRIINIPVAWTTVTDADVYGLTLDIQTIDGWENVLTSDDLHETEYMLKRELFAGVTQARLYRIGICAQGILESDVRYGYFTVEDRPLDESLSVNGKSAITWNQAHRYASSVHTFTVESELPWEVTCDADWIAIEKTGDNSFEAQIAEESHNGFYRHSTEITVSNGINTVCIAVMQEDQAEAPIIEKPIVFSADRDNPSIYPVGDFSIDWKDDYQYYRLRIYDLSSNVCIYEKNQSSSTAALSAQNIGCAFEVGKLYAIELTGFCDAAHAENEFEADALKATYYFRMVNSGHFITVNGEESILLSDITSHKVRVVGANLWSCSSDAEWLSSSIGQSTKNEDAMTVRASENTGDAIRTGHITLNCGAAQAVITVTQYPHSSEPRVVYPDNLSQTESAPTLINFDAGNAQSDALLDIAFYGDSFSFSEQQSAGVYGEEVAVYHSSKPDYDDVSFPTTGNYAMTKKNTTYRLTIAVGEEKRYYYLRFTNTASGAASAAAPIRIDGALYASETLTTLRNELSVALEASTSWKLSSNASWLTVNKSSGTAGTSSILVTAMANTTGAVRSGRLTFSDRQGNYCVYYDVLQHGQDSLEVIHEDSDQANMLDALFQDGDGKYIDYRAYSSNRYTVSCNADWIYLDYARNIREKSYKSGTSFFLYLDDNPSNGCVRTGTVTVSCGAASKTFMVSQAPMLGEVSLLSPALSTSYKNPTLIAYEDLTLRFARVQNAVRYEIYEIDSYDSVPVQDIGISDYIVTLPKRMLLPNNSSDTFLQIVIEAYDQYGHSTRGDYCVIPALDNLVLLNGSDVPVWENVTDVATSADYQIQALDNWTAAAQQSWIHLSASSGASGDTLTVSLDENNASAARSGQVIVISGSAATTLEISQCGMLPEIPEILSPVYSNDKTSPTLIPKDTTSLTVTWPQAIQAEHQVSILEYSTRSAGRILTRSSLLHNGEMSYTFENLSLQQGQLYILEFMRDDDRWHALGIRRYFMLSDENAWIEVRNVTSEEDLVIELDGDEDHDSCTIDAGGVWTASTSDDWIMVYKRSVDQQDLDEDGDTTADYATYTGLPGTDLYISALANPTAAPRTGTVYLSYAGASLEISVKQYQEYSVAQLTAPTLGTKPSETVQIPYGDLKLRWGGASGGTGRYELALYESETRYGSSRCIYERSNISATSHTIAASRLTENMYYRLWLGTELAEDDYSGKNYYFKLDYEDALSAQIVLTDDTAEIGRHLGINVYASGGSGDYQYSYQLMQGDRVLQQSTYERMSYYSFAVSQQGEYHIRVYIKDSSDNVIIRDSAAFSAVVSQESISLSQTEWVSSADASHRSFTVQSTGAWIASATKSWIGINTSASAVEIILEQNTDTQARSGEVCFKTGSATATLRIEQAGITPTGSRIALSNSVWSIQSPAAAFTRISVTASGEWSVLNKPDWITLSMEAGNGNALIDMYASANRAATRNGTILIGSGNETVDLLVTQSGNDIAFGVDRVQASTLSPLTGEEVIFSISAPAADRVVLAVDGIRYDEIWVNNGTAELCRSFSLGGSRRVSFIPYIGSVQGTASQELILNVRSLGALAAPSWQFIGQMNLGETKRIDWADVPNAQAYTIRVYLNGYEFLKETVDESVWTIPQSISTVAGVYSLQIMATGKGWTQSESAEIFSVIEPPASHALIGQNSQETYVLADGNFLLQAENPDRNYLAFRVEHNGTVIYYPHDGTVNSASPLFYAAMDGTGEYSIQLEAYANADRSGSPWGPTMRKTVYVNGPICYDMKVGSVGSYENLFASKSTKVSVETNNAPIEVELYIDGTYACSLVRGELTDRYHYIWSGSIPIQTEGKHSYYFKAVDKDGNQSDEKNWTVTRYVITDASAVLYPSQVVAMLKQPFADSALVCNAIYPCEVVTVQGQFGAYYYCEARGNYGYILKNQLQSTLPTVWNGLSVAFTGFIEKNQVLYREVNRSRDVGLRLSWQTNIKNLPANVLNYRLTLINQANNQEIRYPTLSAATKTLYVSDMPSIPEGCYLAKIEVVSNDGSIVYASAISTYSYTWTDNILDCFDADGRTAYIDSLEVLINGVHNLENANNYFRPIRNGGGMVIDEQGTRYECPEIEKLSDNAIYRTYQLLCTGDWDIAIGADFTRNWYIAESIMTGLSTFENSALSGMDVAVSDIKEIFEMIGFAEDSANLIGMMQIIAQGGRKTFKYPFFESVMHNPYAIDFLEEVKWLGEVEQGVKCSKALIDVVKKILIYSNVDRTRLEEVIAGLRNAGSNGRAIADNLRVLSNREGMIAYVLGSQGFDHAKSLLNKHLSKAVVWAGLPKSWALAVDAGVGFNNVVFNTDKVQTAAAKAKWSKDIAQEYYMNTFYPAYIRFLDDPISEFSKFRDKAITFENLVAQEYKAMAEFFKEVPYNHNSEDLEEKFTFIADILRTQIDPAFSNCEESLTSLGITIF